MILLGIREQLKEITPTPYIYVMEMNSKVKDNSKFLSHLQRCCSYGCGFLSSKHLSLILGFYLGPEAGHWKGQIGLKVHH